MGNTTCCSSCPPFQPGNQSVMSSMPLVTEMSHIDDLISYIDQLLNPREGQVAKPDRVVSSIKAGGDLLEKVLKLANRHTCKMGFMPKLDRETCKLAINITKEGAHIKWLGVALSIICFVLERIEQVSSNINECKELLKYMCNLAKYIKQLDQQVSQQTLNEVLQFILKGSLMCILQMKRDHISRFFATSVDAEDLRSYLLKLGHKYSELTLEALTNVLHRIPAVLPPSQGNYPHAVGIEAAKDHVIELLNIEDKSKKVVVIYGQGGIGKTTLATAVFNHLNLDNYKICRIDIEQNCVERDLKLLQEKILRDLFGRNLGLSSWVEGQQELSKAFEKGPRRPVFMFVDNALKSSDLEKLLPIKDLPLLPEQSRILLTTRNLNETRIIRQTNIEFLWHQVDSLPRAEAHKLLCEYALGSGKSTFHPTIEVDGLLRICSGIPLVLRLAGSRLREHAQSVRACKDAVEYIKEELLQGGDAELSERMVDFVHNRFQQSSKEAFQDIAFFFPKYDWKRERLANALGEMELLELERAALVNVTEAGRLNVHDIVKARGRILSDGYRITDEQSLSDVLQDPQKIQNTKGIDLSQSECKLEAEHLNLMSRTLRVLILRKLNIVNGDCKGIFEDLRLLCLDYNIYSRMDTCKFPRLAVFIGFINEGDTFCEFSGDVSSLKELNLERATLVNLSTTLCQIKSLRSLTLIHCKGFTSIPETIGNLSALEKLDLSYCSSLVSLPNNFGNLLCLKSLQLRYCSNLVGLPESIGQLSSLCDLDLYSCTQLSVLPESFGNLFSLNMLILGRCEKVPYLPQNFGQLKSLKFLSINGCKGLHSLSSDFGCLSSLIAIKASKCPSLSGITMDILAEMKNLMFVDINGSPGLIKRWEQVKEQYSLAVLFSETPEVRVTSSPKHTRYPQEDIMCRAFFHSASDAHEDIMCRPFFHSASRLLQLDGDGKFRESSSSSTFSADGERLALLFTLCNLTSPENSRSLETVKKKCVELGSQGFHIIYVEMGGLWEETETRVKQTLPHLPRGSHAWIAPDNRARQLIVHSWYQFDRDHSLMLISTLMVHTFIASISTWVDEEERRRLQCNKVIFPKGDEINAMRGREDGGSFERLLFPLKEAFKFVSPLKG